jgi:hypothetical protein
MTDSFVNVNKKKYRFVYTVFLASQLLELAMRFVSNLYVDFLLMWKVTTFDRCSMVYRDIYIFMTMKDFAVIGRGYVNKSC